MRKASTGTAACIAAAILLIVPVSPANASSGMSNTAPVSVSEVESQIVERLRAFEVAEADIPGLVEKWRQGEPWDSMTGAVPVSVSREVERGVRATTERFEDGSVVVNSVEIPLVAGPQKPGVQSVEGCRFAAGVGNFPFYDCRVITNTPLFDLNFLADGATSSLGQARVSNLRDPQWLIVGGTAFDSSLSVIRAQQSGTSPAHGKLTVFYNVIFGAGTGTYTLNFFVRDQTMWDTNVG